MSTRAKIIELAQDMSMSSGFNGFSYRDIANELGIKPAAIHYHFPKKDDLGVAIAKDYYDQDIVTLTDSRQNQEPTERIQTFKHLFTGLIKRRRLCLFVVVETGRNEVPEEMVARANEFTVYALDWLQETFAEGAERGQFKLSRAPRELANELYLLCFGALIFSYNCGDLEGFEKIFENWSAQNLQ